ncbi:MAG: L-histidine N(alpha)-methyltransferase [Planctomycetes bacterium]|nr:L-histidine N(alpha)-methyltransferase [Planctomycetota bacterium]
MKFIEPPDETVPVPRAVETDQFRVDVLRGLRRPAKELPCKYFYDETGSRLFEQICELEEYYLTRTELTIMRKHASEMAELLGPDCLLVEYGSGSSVKTRLLLDRLKRVAAYVPLDVSREHLLRSAGRLAARYPNLEVLPLWADFTGAFRLPVPSRRPARRVVYFPGSTLGNFDAQAATLLLAGVARLCGPGGAMLLGIDLKKDVRILELAYNDAKGVTAAFNLNLLTRINRELGANFDVAAFRHRAPYNRVLGCIEMHLVSLRPQQVRLADEVFSFAEGEFILSERSFKYDLDEFRAWAPRAGLRVERAWVDGRNYFAVVYLTVP